MHKFKFKLEGVLAVKERLEEQAKGEFGMAMQDLAAKEEARDVVKERIRGYENKLESLLEGNLDVLQIGTCRSALKVLEEDLDECNKAVKRAENRVELCRTRLNNAVKERKTIEKLKEKEFEAYVKEYNDEEHKQIDELVSYRHGVNKQK